MIAKKNSSFQREFKHKRFGAPGRIRTYDLELRSLLLYPAELRAHGINNGAGWGSRNPVSSLENLHINRYTNPARDREIIAERKRAFLILQHLMTLMAKM